MTTGPGRPAVPQIVRDFNELPRLCSTMQKSSPFFLCFLMTDVRTRLLASKSTSANLGTQCNESEKILLLASREGDCA